MGVARIFSGGNTFKKFSKNFQKYSKDFQEKFKKFSKIFKNFLKKIAKMLYYSIVFSQLNNAPGQVLGVWTKNAIFRMLLIKFSKIFKRFLKKTPKNALF